MAVLRMINAFETGPTSPVGVGGLENASERGGL